MSKLIPQKNGQPATTSNAAVPCVCVVDPRPSDYEGWDQAAQELGVRLEFVTNASAALRQAHLRQVDLWVVNSTLIGLSGTELCHMLKAQSGQNVVYVVADEYSAAIEQDAHASRANLFECKPLTCSRLESWFALWQKRRAAVPPRQTAVRSLRTTETAF